jgi:hypothetical protein
VDLGKDQTVTELTRVQPIFIFFDVEGYRKLLL